MVAENEDPSENSSVPPKGRSCAGLLYFSSHRKSRARNPLCFGLSRTEPKEHYTAEKSQPDPSKDGRALLDFKYACVGYSVHGDNQATISGVEQDKHVDLPLCMGIEVLAERRAASQGANDAKIQHINHHENHEKKEVARIMPRPPSSIQTPSTIGNFGPEEFSGRFIRSAGLVAAAVGKNLSRVGNSVKAMAVDIFHPNSRRPK